jgi:hypothetical protein
MRQSNTAAAIMTLIAVGTLAACGQSSEQAAETDAPEMPEPTGANWQEFTFVDLKIAKRFPSEPTRTEGTYWEWPLTGDDRDPEVAGEAPSTMLTASVDYIDYEVTIVPLSNRVGMGASIMGECAYLTEESGVEQKNTFVQIDNGNRTVYGHQVVVDRHDDLGRMHNGCFFENGTFYLFSATVHQEHGDLDAPEAQAFITNARFIDGT